MIRPDTVLTVEERHSHTIDAYDEVSELDRHINTIIRLIRTDMDMGSLDRDDLAWLLEWISKHREAAFERLWKLCRN